MFIVILLKQKNITKTEGLSE